MDTLNDDSRSFLKDQNDTENYSKYLELINNCNESDPLLSETPLGQRLEQIQLARVPPADLIKLSQALNVEQLIPTQSGPPRDYRGLSELMGFSSIELEARFRRSHNPAKSLIEAYIQKRRFQRHQHDRSKEANLNELLKFLETLERFDIIDDSIPILIKLAQQQQVQNRANNDQNHVELGPSNSLESTQRPVQYDAFVCFAPEDEAHARELIYILEHHNKRIFTIDHLLPGQLEFDALIQIIASDCHKVIIVLTPNFFRSRECDFQAKFAAELDIKSGWSAKIIPVKCEHVNDSKLPPLIRVLSKIDMTSGSHGREWQLRRLLNSLAREHSKADHYQQNEAAPSNRQHFRTYRESDGCETPERGEFVPHQLNSPQPIIDLAYSQCSDSTLNLSKQLSIMTSGNDRQENLSVSRISSPSPSTSGFYLNERNPQTNLSCTSTNQLDPWYKRKNWYQKIKRSFRDISSKSSCESNSPSTSSQVQLVLQESGDEKNQL